MRIGQTFEKDAKVTFDLDPTGEIFIVVESGYYSTAVLSLDGIDISFRTTDLSYAQIPAAAI